MINPDKRNVNLIALVISIMIFCILIIFIQSESMGDSKQHKEVNAFLENNCYVNR